MSRPLYLTSRRFHSLTGTHHCNPVPLSRHNASGGGFFAKDCRNPVNQHINPLPGPPGNPLRIRMKIRLAQHHNILSRWRKHQDFALWLEH